MSATLSAIDEIAYRRKPPFNPSLLWIKWRSSLFSYMWCKKLIKNFTPNKHNKLNTSRIASFSYLMITFFPFMIWIPSVGLWTFLPIKS